MLVCEYVRKHDSQFDSQLLLLKCLRTQHFGSSEDVRIHDSYVQINLIVELLTYVEPVSHPVFSIFSLIQHFVRDFNNQKTSADPWEGRICSKFKFWTSFWLVNRKTRTGSVKAVPYFWWHISEAHGENVWNCCVVNNATGSSVNFVSLWTTFLFWRSPRAVIVVDISSPWLCSISKFLWIASTM